MSSFNLRAIISCVDRLTPVLNAQSRHIRAWGRSFERAGRGAIPMAAGLATAVLIPARAFMEAEDAATQLKSVLMTSDGLSSGFEGLMKIATDLGNKLPGTTADFAHMATVMKANNLNTTSLIDGGLQAAAYLAVATKGLGETYDSAATGIAKVSNVFSVADSDLVGLADTMQRVVHMGVGIDDFVMAMSKAGGPLKGLKVQGIEVANQMAPLVAMLVQAGVDASEAGTGLKTMISEEASAGKFTNVANLVKNLEAANKLKPAALFEKFEKLFGKEHASKALIIASGGYAEIMKKMKEQADLQQRINAAMESLTNLWDAATGTFTNAQVAFATIYAPELKKLAKSINDVSESLLTWATNNGPAIKVALEMAAAFVGLKLVIFGIGIAFKVLKAIMATNPWVLLLMAIVTLAPLIYENWGAICDFFKTAWQDTVTGATAIWTNFTSALMSAWELWKTGIMLGITAVGDAFTALLPASVVAIFSGIIDQLTAKFNAFVAFIKSGISGIQSVISGISNFFGQTPNGMRPPGQSGIPAIPKAATTVPKVSNVIPMPKVGTGRDLSLPMQSVANVNKMPKAAREMPMMNVNNVIKMPKAAQSMPVSNVIKMPKAAQSMPVSNVIKMPKAAQSMPMQNVVANAADFLPKSQGNQPAQNGPRKSFIQPQQPVRGNIDVNFKNAPAGMRVEPSKERGPVSVTPNVGYRSFAGGSA
jgi:hypothetical protein